MGVATSLFQRWWGRTTAAVTLAALLAVVMTLTGIVGQGEPDATTPVGAAAGPPPAPDPEPAAPAVEAPAPQPAPAMAEPAASVRRAPVAGAARYPGALLDAPDSALGAYQRAAAIINVTADCHLDWMTLAAIARIESNHGRGSDDAHEIDKHGVVTPALVGQPLNGKAGRGQVDDTDGGELDGNRRWDAPVGPFGLLPGTWALVAVDADSDDVRDPQDLDDASLAAAVVLCAGGRDLADADTLRKALTSYHRTQGFAATVIVLTALYVEEMKSVPVFMPAPGTLPIPDDLAEICDCAREDKAQVRSLKPSMQNTPAGPGSSGGVAGPPPADPGTLDPGDVGDPVDPPVDPPVEPPAEPPVEPSADPDPVDPPADPDPVDPAPSTEPEPAPEPVDPPAAPEPEPEPSADRTATAEPEPEPAPEPEPEPEPEAEAAPAGEG